MLTTACHVVHAMTCAVVQPINKHHCMMPKIAWARPLTVSVVCVLTAVASTNQLAVCGSKLEPHTIHICTPLGYGNPAIPSAKVMQ